MSSLKLKDMPNKLIVGGLQVEFSDSVKYLGATFDKGLSWNIHFNNQMFLQYESIASIARNRHCMALEWAGQNIEHRSANWRNAKRETDGLIKEEKRNYYNAYVDKAKKTNDASLYYKAVARLGTAERQSPFSPSDLFPGLSDAEVSEKVADFFTQISDKFDPLTSGD